MVANIIKSSYDMSNLKDHSVLSQGYKWMSHEILSMIQSSYIQKGIEKTVSDVRIWEKIAIDTVGASSIKANGSIEFMYDIDYSDVEKEMSSKSKIGEILKSLSYGDIKRTRYPSDVSVDISEKEIVIFGDINTIMTSVDNLMYNSIVILILSNIFKGR